MNDHLPAMPSQHELTRPGREPRGAGRVASVLTLLAFGFAANALLSTPQALAPAEPQAARPTTEQMMASETAPGLATAESPEVTAAVRNWIWETPGTDRRSPAGYDFEELWLPR